MKFILLSIMLLFGLFSFANNLNDSIDTNSRISLYDININSLMGDEINLGDFKGKKILFVNVASKCGYTGQYKGLQELHELHGDDLVLIGVPCNQFGLQEPGDANEIADFCEKNYGVTFLITEKVKVKGSDQHGLYAWLTKKSMNGELDSKVKWNFQKYLVDESGVLKEKFASSVKPMDTELLDAIK